MSTQHSINAITSSTNVASGSTWTYDAANQSTSTSLTGNMSHRDFGSPDGDTIIRFDECDPTLPSCHAQRVLFFIFGPTLCVMAVIGNSLGIAVMRRRPLRHTASAVFITSLALSDTTAVLTALIRHMHLKLNQVDVRQFSVISCTVQRFILYVSLDTSAWILIAISVERFLAVCYPQKHRLLKKPKRAVIVVLSIIAFQMAFNFHVFFTRGREYIEERNKTVECGYPTLAAKRYWTFYHGWLSMTVYCFLPFGLMLSLNSAVICRLRSMNRRFSSQRQSTKSKRRTTTSMTRMLLCVTFYFVVVTTPAFIFTYYQDRLFFTSKLTREQYADSELVDAVLTLLLYLNHSINFFLYCASGRRFRMELIAMLREVCRLGGVDNGQLTCDQTDGSELKKSTFATAVPPADGEQRSRKQSIKQNDVNDQ